LHATQLGATGGARRLGAFSTGVRVDWGLSYTTVLVTIATVITVIINCVIYAILTN